jgi:hypothetical protein
MDIARRRVSAIVDTAHGYPTVLDRWTKGSLGTTRAAGVRSSPRTRAAIGAMAYWRTATKVSDDTKAHLGILRRVLLGSGLDRALQLASVSNLMRPR